MVGAANWAVEGKINPILATPSLLTETPNVVARISQKTLFIDVGRFVGPREIQSNRRRIRMLEKRSCANFIFLAAACVAAGTACTPEAANESIDASMAGTESVAPAPASAKYGIPGSRERFEIQKELIADKLEKALLPAMRSHDVDMWVVLNRENNPDPLHVELGGRFSGVRAAYVFFDNGCRAQKLYRRG